MCEVLDLLNEPRSKIFDFLLKTTGASSSILVNYSDYISFVGACAMFGLSELTSVAFAYADPEQTSYLTKQRFFR